MTGLEALRALVRGAPAATGILGDCRLESSGVDAFGIEAVSDNFRRAPMADAQTAMTVEATGTLAIFGVGEAVFADLFGNRIGRLWRVGQADPGTPEPAVAVAFDTDLRQARADVFIDAADHPALNRGGADRATALGRGLVGDMAPEFRAFRARAFTVRAFGNGDAGCALFAIHALSPNPVRTPYLAFAAVRWDGVATQVVRDGVRLSARQIRIAS